MHVVAATPQGAAADRSAHDPARAQPGDHDGVRHRRDRLAARHRRHRRRGAAQGSRRTMSAPPSRRAWRSCLQPLRSTASRPASGTSATFLERCRSRSRRRGWRCSPASCWRRSAITRIADGGRASPTSLVVDIKPAVDRIVEWVGDNLRRGVPIIGGTQAISDFLVTNVMEPLREFLVWLPWLVVVALIGLIGWAQRRLAARAHRCRVHVRDRGDGRRRRAAPAGARRCGTTPWTRSAR